MSGGAGAPCGRSAPMQHSRGSADTPVDAPRLPTLAAGRQDALRLGVALDAQFDLESQHAYMLPQSPDNTTTFPPKGLGSFIISRNNRSKTSTVHLCAIGASFQTIGLQTRSTARQPPRYWPSSWIYRVRAGVQRQLEPAVHGGAALQEQRGEAGRCAGDGDTPVHADSVEEEAQDEGFPTAAHGVQEEDTTIFFRRRRCACLQRFPHRVVCCSLFDVQ
eukprot:1178038-Prorocentrum_minimum.AAC.3